MPNLGIEIKRKCEICGNVFVIKTLDSIYCSPKCSKIASKRKKDKEKKEALFAAYAQTVPDIREYLTAKQVVAISRTHVKVYSSNSRYLSRLLIFYRAVLLRRISSVEFPFLDITTFAKQTAYSTSEY